MYRFRSEIDRFRYIDALDGGGTSPTTRVLPLIRAARRVGNEGAVARLERAQPKSGGGPT